MTSEYESFFKQEKSTENAKVPQPVANDLSDTDSPSEFDAFFRSLKQEEDQTLFATTMKASTTSPDTIARAKTVGEELELPTDIAERNLTELEPKAQGAKLRRQLRDQHKTAAFFQNAENAALASDDVESLSTLENLFAGIKERAGAAAIGFNDTVDAVSIAAGAPRRALTRAVGNVLGIELAQREPVGLASAITDLADAVVEVSTGEETNRVADIREFDFGFEESVTWDEVKDQPLENVLPFIGEQFAISTPDMLLGLVNLPALTASMTGRVASDRRENNNEVDTKPTLQDLINALPAATASAFLERLGARGMLGLDDGLKEVSIRGITAATGKAAVKEGATEFAQELLENAGATVGTEKGFDVAEAVEAGFQGMVVGSGSGAGIRASTATVEATGTKLIERARKSKAATAAKAALDDIDAVTRQSKLNTRAPGKLAEFTGNLMRGQDIGSVYIPAERLYQSDIDLDLTKLDIADQIDEAVAIGSDVEITAEAFAEHILGTDNYAALSDHIRFEPDALTSAEAAIFETDGIQDALAEVQDVDPESFIETETQTIHREMEAQLEAIGEAPQNAQFQAILIAQRYATRAERLGASALDLFRQDNLILQGPEAKAQFNEDLRMVDVLRSGQTAEEFLELSPTPVLDLLKGEGVDPSGPLAAELKAMDITTEKYHGLYRNGGLMDADTFVPEGVFAETEVEGNYIPQNVVLDTVRSELAGEPLRTSDELDRILEFNASKERIRERLESAGLNEGSSDTDIQRSLSQSSPTIEINSDDLGSDMTDLKALRNAAVKYYRSVLQSSDGVQNPVVGRVQFNSSGRRKFSSATERQTWLAVTKLDEIVAAARRDGPARDDYRGRKDIKAIHPMIANITIDGEAYTVRLQLRELKDGTFHYDTETLPAPVKPAPNTGGEPGVRNSGLEQAPIEDVSPSDENINLSLKPLAQSRRGSISFTDKATILELGANADRSTFLHESGHLFLEQLKEDAASIDSNQIIDDWNTVTIWWVDNAVSLKAEAIAIAKAKGDTKAASDLEAMTEEAVKDFIRFGELSRDGTTGYIGTAMHEQWARGTEDYFRTGEAPSVALQDAFNRFRAWLVSIYRALKRRVSKDVLDVTFSKDVRQVMDRLLATDEEIALVQEQYDLKALFTSAKEIGMTPAQFAAYQKAVARASEAAKTNQLRKHLREIEREKLAWWNDEKAKRVAEVEQEFSEKPVYRAMYALTSGRTATGESLHIKPTRLSRDRINEIYGNTESIKRLPKVNGRAVYATAKGEGSANPDVVAQFYGYRNGREMLDALANAEPFKEAVEADAEARMKSEFGDMLNDGSAETKALESSHTDKRGDVLAMELNALRASQEKIKPAFVRQWAKQKIADKKVERIKPETFLAAERRWGREAGKQLRAGNRLEAQRAKFRQMMNFYMAKEAYAVRDELTKARKYVGKFGKRKAKFKSVDADYIEKIRTILSAYQFGPRLSDRKRTLLEMQSLNDWIKQQETDDGAILNVPPQILAADGKTYFRDLTLGEFRTLIDSIKNLESQGRLKRKIKVGRENRDIDEVIAEAVDHIERLPDSKRAIRTEGRQNPTRWDRAKANLASFDASLRKVEFLLEKLDGERLGVLHQALFQPFADAQARSADMTQAITDKIGKMLRDMPKEVQDSWTEDIEVPLLGRTFQRSDLIMMALNVGNDSNLEKMLEGSKRDAFGGQVWTQEGVDQALSNLTKQEWEFVQSVWDTFEAMWPDVAEIHRQEFGVAPERVEPRHVETEHGTFQGGYYPVQYDPSRSQAARDLESKTALEAMQSETVKASVNSSMTKARTGFSAPVNLDIASLTAGLDRTVHYVTHYEAVRSSRKLLARPDLQRAITRKLGPEYYAELKDWLGAVASNGQDQKAHGWWHRTAEIMRTNATIAVMGFSYSTMTAQLLGYANSVDALAKQSSGYYSPAKATVEITSAMQAYMRRPKQVTRDVMTLSGEMRHRLGNINRELSDALKDVQGRGGAWSKLQRFSLEVIGRVQLYGVDIPTWQAAYNIALKEGRSPDEAVKFADNIIRISQTGGAVKDLSNLQRQRGVMRMLTMFYSYFNLLYNIAAQASEDTKRVKDVPKLAARAFIVLTLPAVLESLRNREGPDEDEDGKWLDEDPGTWLQWAAVRTGIYLFGAIPVVGPSVNSATKGFTPTLSPVEQLGESTAESIQRVARDIDEGEVSTSTVKSFTTMIGFGVGAPSVQVNRFIDAVEAMQEGEEVSEIDFLAGHKN